MTSPPSFIIARPGLPFPYSSQLLGVPGLFIRLSTTSEINFSMLFVSCVLVNLFSLFSIELSITPKIIKIIINITVISIVLLPLLSIINQPIFFSVRIV